MTAANQENEANIVKQNVYFMGLLYSEIVCFFFCYSGAFSIRKYDGSRLQDVLFCFKTALHENTKN